VRLYIAPLFVNDASQFPLHRFEGIVDHFVEWLMCAVVHLLFIGHEFVTARNRHVNAAPVRISFLMRMVGLLDGDIAAVDMIAKSFQSRCVIQNEVVDLAGFFQAPVSDLNRQLHNYWTLTHRFFWAKQNVCE
jgi:hypothetical protein